MLEGRLAQQGVVQPRPPPVDFAPAAAVPVPRLLDAVSIAIARDEVFSFLYPANLELLDPIR